MTPWSPLLDASDLTAEHAADMRAEHDGDWVDERVPTRGEVERDEWGWEW